MRILGVDYGRTRIGLALSDPTVTIASPIGNIINKGIKNNLAAFSDVIKKYGVQLIVMGKALHMDGNESEISIESKHFGDILHKETGVQVTYYDERFTTKMAQTEIRQNMGRKDPKKIAQIVDTVAASMLLQEYINYVYKKEPKK